MLPQSDPTASVSPILVPFLPFPIKMPARHRKGYFYLLDSFARKEGRNFLPMAGEARAETERQALAGFRTATSADPADKLVRLRLPIYLLLALTNFRPHDNTSCRRR